MRNINRLNFRDIQALNGLRVCGYAMRADMEKIISRNRVEVFLKRGYLEQRVDCRERSVLTCTDKGKALIKKIDTLQGRTFYPKQPNAVKHDTTLFHQCVSLSPTECMTAYSETETRDIYRESLEQMRNGSDHGDSQRQSIPDMVYTSTSGELVAVEITTSNYTQEKLELKEATAQTIGASIHFVKV